jgi:hypothetical protein
VCDDRVVDRETQHDLQATLDARRELGPAHDDDLVRGFLERLERRVGPVQADPEELKRRRDHQKELILGGMGISVPMLAIAGFIAGLPGIIAVCAALVAVVYAATRG